MSDRFTQAYYYAAARNDARQEQGERIVVQVDLFAFHYDDLGQAFMDGKISHLPSVQDAWKAYEQAEADKYSIRYIVTNAPEAYDYGTARTIETGDKHLRIVEIATTREDVDFLANYQADRYRSGLYMACVFDGRPTIEQAVEA